MRPILGQECVTDRYGLGRVTELPDGTWVGRGQLGVTPYVAGYQMRFEAGNVRLIPIPETVSVSA